MYICKSFLGVFINGRHTNDPHTIARTQRRQPRARARCIWNITSTIYQWKIYMKIVKQQSNCSDHAQSTLISRSFCHVFIVYSIRGFVVDSCNGTYGTYCRYKYILALPACTLQLCIYVVPAASGRKWNKMNGTKRRNSIACVYVCASSAMVAMCTLFRIWKDTHTVLENKKRKIVKKCTFVGKIDSSRLFFLFCSGRPSVLIKTSYRSSWVAGAAHRNRKKRKKKTLLRQTVHQIGFHVFMQIDSMDHQHFFLLYSFSGHMRMYVR